MQVEYESSPAIPGEESTFQEVESFSFRPGQDQDEGEGEGEGEGDESRIEKPTTAKKASSKPRQSLAEKQLGTTIFPLSRVKKIIKADKELDNMSSEAVFMTAVATEYFIKHFMEEGYTKARLEKRKTVNYKDMAAVVARSEEFDFLKDVIPQPINLSEALERRKQKLSNDENPSLHDPTHPDHDHAINEDDLPPLAISTNPLFPNAIMKKPPNTHAKTAMPRPQAQAQAATSIDDEGDVPVAVEDPLPEQVVSKPSSSRKSLGSKEKEKERERERAGEKMIFTGKNAPSTPHGLTTRGAARRSLAGTDVDMSPVAQLRNEIAEEGVVEVGVEDPMASRVEDEDEKME
ncbi:hypothetical protein I302_108419 [Kwoniella bestiolae CBS 10118]|uniref:Transcription factor CBF/NF-Y/archaeal histone domain-containing protein n=1 Tax=Kwoniella bestiolae CBS 10118 TaxID=1296100 RepID=A0A1B9FVT1_9TREE|nr:hypothetical protein I302_07206 [Kwoniella bestiolae CBS 10118]OCF22861.1 hypothetical protein I302_07206 [Kwoniella bestiolae CBS 10118]